MFDADAVAREARDTGEPFGFTLDGREWTLPPFTAATPEHIDLLGQRDLVALLADVGGQELADVARRTPFRALDALVGAWIRSGGVEPGESSASPDS